MSSTSELPAVGAGLRWGRAVTVAAMAWCIASAAHVLAGGHLPPVTTMILFVAVTAWPLTFGLRVQASGLRLLALLGAGQVMMHVAFVGAGIWVTSSAATPALARMQDHDAGANLPATAVPTQTGEAVVVGAGHSMALVPGPLMLVAHVVAAVLVGYVLATGERTLFSVLGLLAQLVSPAVRICRHVLRVLAVVLADTGPAEAALTGPRWGEDVWRLAPHLLVRAVGRRGPPRSAVFIPLGLRP